MAALAGTVAVALQVDGECPHVVGRHSPGEALITPGVLAEAVHDREGDGGAGVRPGAVSDLASSGGLNESVGGDGGLRRQGDPGLSGS